MINKLTENVYQLCFNQFGSTVYLLQLNNKNILIDTSIREAKQELLQDLENLKIKPEQINIIIITHHHWDHDANINLFSKAIIYDYNNISKLNIKNMKIYKVPGHTKDSIAILYKEFLFSGDTLFHEGIGRTDFPESQPEKMQESLNFLRNLPYKILCPGHV